MNKDFAKEVLEKAEMLTDSPHSFIISIMHAIELALPKEAERISIVKDEFDTTFGKLYNNAIIGITAETAEKEKAFRDKLAKDN